MDRERQRILRLPEVRSVTGLSGSGIYRMVAAGEFPAQVQPARRSVRWREEDIPGWVESRPTVSK